MDAAAPPPAQPVEKTGNNNLSLKVLEEESIRAALKATKGNQREAAKLLDITRDTLRYRMKKLGIDSSR
jgi:DNA-binding NtrC family response regulator